MRHLAAEEHRRARLGPEHDRWALNAVPALLGRPKAGAAAHKLVGRRQRDEHGERLVVLVRQKSSTFTVHVDRGLALGPLELSRHVQVPQRRALVLQVLGRRLRLVVESGKSSTLGRPEASC